MPDITKIEEESILEQSILNSTKNGEDEYQNQTRNLNASKNEIMNSQEVNNMYYATPPKHLDYKNSSLQIRNNKGWHLRGASMQ